ncbi:hypothetical protein GS538_00030 [Rhodococcus hoagii]|nr:hypothetical protein [Prescottella equi]
MAPAVAVPPGSFDIDDVEHICGEDCAGDLLDILASLVDKSIIVREDARGRARYRMLDTVRGYGANSWTRPRAM